MRSELIQRVNREDDKEVPDCENQGEVEEEKQNPENETRKEVVKTVGEDTFSYF